MANPTPDAPGLQLPKAAGFVARPAFGPDGFSKSQGVSTEDAYTADQMRDMYQRGLAARPLPSDWVAVPREPTWIVNDLGELGVMVDGVPYFLYKGDNIVYDEPNHEDGTPMLYRIVGKREFGETCWPLKWVAAGRREDRYTEKLHYAPGLSDGKPEDGDWRPLPVVDRKAAPSATAEGGVSPGDAVFAFSAMLTSLPHVIPLGGAAWATPGADLAAAFNEANGLSVSRDFPEGLQFPEIEGKLLEVVKRASEEIKTAPEPLAQGEAIYQFRDAYGAWRDTTKSHYDIETSLDKRILYASPQPVANPPQPSASAGEAIAWFSVSGYGGSLFVSEHKESVERWIAEQNKDQDRRGTSPGYRHVGPFPLIDGRITPRSQAAAGGGGEVRRE